MDRLIRATFIYHLQHIALQQVVSTSKVKSEYTKYREQLRISDNIRSLYVSCTRNIHFETSSVKSVAPVLLYSVTQRSGSKLRSTNLSVVKLGTVCKHQCPMALHPVSKHTERGIKTSLKPGAPTSTAQMCFYTFDNNSQSCESGTRKPKTFQGMVSVWGQRQICCVLDAPDKGKIRKKTQFSDPSFLTFRQRLSNNLSGSHQILYG